MSTLGVNFKDLRTAVDWSIRQMAKPRETRVSSVQEFVGYHYAKGGSQNVVPTNFLELAVTIYMRQLAARAPRVTVSSHIKDLRPFAANLQLAINQIPDEIGLGSTLRRAVLEALFSIGIVKVGLCKSKDEIMGHDVGRPFVDIVELDDYFCDMSARHRSVIQFEGNDYWLPLEIAREMYGDNTRKKIEADQHTIQGDQGEKRAESISKEEGADLYRKKVWLRDVWLPHENKLVTYGVKSLEIMNIVEWDGPEHSPYYVLGYSDVPGNVMPLAPVALWRDLHELGNNLFRRLGRQAEAKKTVAAFQGGNDDDVNNLQRASDGEGIKYSGPKPEALTVGGIDAPTLAFYLQVKDLFSYFAGNLDSMGGLSPQSETVGQDRLLTEAATARMRDMAETTADFARDIFRALAWYEWTDPLRSRKLNKTVPGYDVGIQTVFSPDVREGNFLDYNFEVGVYSMADDSPADKMQKIGMALERFVFPALPLYQQQGGQISLRAMIDLIAQLGNIPELKDVVVFASDETIEESIQLGGEASGPAKPATTTRRYERVNRPGATRSGKDDVMARLLLGQKVQQAEGASLSRGVG